MKNLKQIYLGALAVVLLIGGSIAFTGCNKENDTNGRNGSNVTGATEPSNAFKAELLSSNVPEDGDYAWTWEIIRNSPSQKQALSHFDFINGFICDEEGSNAGTLSDHVVGAYYSTDGGATWKDNGVNWSNDPSTDDCHIGDVLKFDVGGDNLLVKLILDDEFEEAPQEAIYKTGGKVQCGKIIFTGVGCPVVPPVNPEWKGETAYGGNTEGAGSGWWFIFDTSGDDVQNIYAGQKLVPGASVTYSGGNFEIDLGDNMILNPNSNESVKAQGYNTLPSTRPASGLFTLYKGTSLTFNGNGSVYYVIHLDVKVNPN